MVAASLPIAGESYVGENSVERVVLDLFGGRAENAENGVIAPG